MAFAIFIAALKKNFTFFIGGQLEHDTKILVFVDVFVLRKLNGPSRQSVIILTIKNFHSFPFSFTSLTEMTRICKTKVAAQILDLFKVVENEHLAHISLIEYSKWVSKNLILLENAVKAQIYFYF